MLRLSVVPPNKNNILLKEMKNREKEISRNFWQMMKIMKLTLMKNCLVLMRVQQVRFTVWLTAATNSSYAFRVLQVMPSLSYL
jgi:hypothetical protein